MRDSQQASAAHNQIDDDMIQFSQQTTEHGNIMMTTSHEWRNNFDDEDEHDSGRPKVIETAMH